MKPVVQLEKTGCGIASVAAVAGVTYKEAQRAAKALGISAADPQLWSDTRPIRRLLQHFGISAAAAETPFRSWQRLPDLALMATKWHREGGKAYWHWAVFVREGGRSCVLDSKLALRRHVRTDLGRIKPKWFIGLRPSD